MTQSSLTIRWLGRQEYLSTWQAMRDFTAARSDETPDEVWLLEHHPVFTQGQNGKPEHVLNPGTIPIVQTDRGGQVTYHGPGQLMAYLLIDLKRKQLQVREFVTAIEESVIDMLQQFNIAAQAKRDAPGVYINGDKICSIGLRIRRGNSYHGIAFNINMDLEPFNRINPCGFSQLRMTQLIQHQGPGDVLTAGKHLINSLIERLRYTTAYYDQSVPDVELTRDPTHSTQY